MKEEIKLTLEQWDKAKIKADELMKKDNGHSFVTILKTRCQFCGKSPKVKTRCGQWFQTFIYRLDYVLMNPEVLNENQG